MLKKRFFLFLAIFSFSVVIFNFSLVSASLSGSSKIRLLSLAMILSFFEIAASTVILSIFLKSAAGFSKKEKQLSLILNSESDGVVVHSALNEILFLNSKAEEILGLNFKDVVGVHLTKESSLRNPKLERVVEVVFFSKVSSSERESFFVEGKEVPEGRFFLKILKRSAEPLQKVSDIEFVTTAAHQLRTPLSGVKWVLKMLLEKPGLDADQISLLKKGQDTNEKVIKIVNDLLETTKIESGKFSYVFNSVNLNSFIESSLANFSSVANEAGVRLNFEKGAEVISNIKADSGKLAMALDNLIDNAIKYTPKGGEVKISAAKKNNFAEISVADTGIGISESEKGKVFSKFFRATNATKIDSAGAGLGLFIVYRIVKDHGGQIKFSPNSPQGSVFSFTIPFYGLG